MDVIKLLKLSVMVTIRQSFYMEVADDTLSGMIKIARCQNSDIFKIKGLGIDDFYLLLAIHKNLKEKLVLLNNVPISKNHMLISYLTSSSNCLMVTLYHLPSWIPSMSNISPPRLSICVDTQILLVSGPSSAVTMQGTFERVLYNQSLPQGFSRVCLHNNDWPCSC